MPHAPVGAGPGADRHRCGQPAWVPTHPTPSPVLTEALYWRHEPGRHLMREAHDVQRDDIFIDLYDKLARAPDLDRKGLVSIT